MYVADRIAVRHLALHASARRPLSAGDPYGCRNCGAPLEPKGPAEGIVVRCVYCDADNVLGLDLRPQARDAEPERRAIERALERRGDERRAGWWRIAAAGSVTVLCLLHWIPSAAAWEENALDGLLLALFVLLSPSVMLPIASVSAVWVYWDAWRLNRALLILENSSLYFLSGRTPRRWAVLCFFFWFWNVPSYVSATWRIRQRIRAARTN